MQNLIWKRRLSYLWPSQLKNRKVILLYHSLGESSWAMSAKLFKDQLHWLTDHTQVVPLQTLIDTSAGDDLQVAITFDDGYRSLHDVAAPLLADKQLSAAVFLNTGWIGETGAARKASNASLGHYPDEAFLTWDEVKRLQQAAWLIGSHGVNHHNFSLMDANLVLQELKQSKQDIEHRLQHPCLHFAYPFGRYSKTAKAIAKQAGYQYAAAARHGAIEKHSDVYALPRINVDKHYSLNDFQNILTGKWDYLNIIHRLKGL